MEAVGDIGSRWEKFEVLMESPSQMLSEQVGVMRSNVESHVTAFNLEVEKFAARWQQMKPSTYLNLIESNWILFFYFIFFDFCSIHVHILVHIHFAFKKKSNTVDSPYKHVVFSNLE